LAVTARPFTIPQVQLGDASRISHLTGLPVVSDFRRADIAAGGQGAPLVPAFHAVLFRKANDPRSKTICNIGGIANITLLPADPNSPVTGFDTGPGNTLLDAWIFKHQNLSFDADGSWAATGKCSATLLSTLLGDPYVQRVPPKSTGVEHYSLDWLETQLDLVQTQGRTLNPADVQATHSQNNCEFGAGEPTRLSATHRLRRRQAQYPVAQRPDKTQQLASCELRHIVCGKNGR